MAEALEDGSQQRAESVQCHRELESWSGAGVGGVGAAPANQLVQCMQKRKLALFGALPFPLHCQQTKLITSIFINAYKRTTCAVPASCRTPPPRCRRFVCGCLGVWQLLKSRCAKKAKARLKHFCTSLALK